MQENLNETLENCAENRDGFSLLTRIFSFFQREILLCSLSAFAITLVYLIVLKSERRNHVRTLTCVKNREIIRKHVYIFVKRTAKLLKFHWHNYHDRIWKCTYKLQSIYSKCTY